MKATRSHLGMLLVLMCWGLLARSSHAQEYVYGTSFSFLRGSDSGHVRRLALTKDGIPRASAAQIVIWKSTSGKVEPVTPTGKQLSGSLRTLVSAAALPSSVKISTPRDWVKHLNENLPRLKADGQLGKSNLYIRRLVATTKPNRDAYLWFLGKLTTAPDANEIVTPSQLSMQVDVTRYVADGSVTPLKDDMQTAWKQAQTSWHALLEPPQSKQKMPENPGRDSTVTEDGQSQGQARALRWWPLALGATLVMALLSGMAWLAWVVRGVQEKLSQLADQNRRDSSGSLHSLADELSSLRYKVDRMHSGLLEMDKALESMGKHATAPPPDVNVNVGVGREEVEEFRRGQQALLDQVEDLRREMLRTQPILSDCVGELVEMKSRLDMEEKKRGAWRFDLIKEWSKALDQRDRSFNQFWENRLGKWQGLRVLEGPALQAQLREALPRLRETLPDLRRREEEMLAWYKKLRDAVRQSGGSLLRMEDLCLLNEAMHLHNLQEMTKDYLPSHLRLDLRLDLREDNQPAEGLRHGLERLVESLADPLESQADGFARELATLARRLHEALDEHAGKALLQIRTLAPVSAERGINWITPPEGGSVDDKQHLVVDYRVGQGATSTIAELLRPGYELRSGEDLLDRVQAQIVVYR